MNTNRRSPIVIRAEEVECVQIGQGIARKRFITSASVGARNLMFSIAYVDPEEKPHSWHKHRGPFFDGEQEREYPEAFEELYFVLRGKCTVFWRMGGKENKRQADEGDLIYFPTDVAEHQVVNTSSEQLVLAVVMAPPFT